MTVSLSWGPNPAVPTRNAIKARLFRRPTGGTIQATGRDPFNPWAGRPLPPIRCAMKVRQPRRDGLGNVDAGQKPVRPEQSHVHAIPPIGTVQADNEAPEPIEMGVHQDLQRAGVERLAERGHAPNRPGVLSARAEDADASLVQERRDRVGRQKRAQQHLGGGAVEKDALPNRRQLLKLRVLVEKSARDLARKERISACRSTRSITASASPRWAAEASCAAPASAQPQ